MAAVVNVILQSTYFDSGSFSRIQATKWVFSVLLGYFILWNVNNRTIYDPNVSWYGSGQVHALLSAALMLCRVNDFTISVNGANWWWWLLLWRQPKVIISLVTHLCKLQYVICLLFAAIQNGLNRSRWTNFQTLLKVLLIQPMHAANASALVSLSSKNIRFIVFAFAAIQRKQSSYEEILLNTRLSSSEINGRVEVTLDCT